MDEGHHSTQSVTAFSNLYLRKILVDVTSQTIKLWSSSPEARYLPQGETEIDRTHVLWKLKSIEIYVGNGFKSFGEGSSGISEFGSVTFIFFFVILGHM